MDPLSAGIIAGGGIIGGLLGNEEHYGPGDYLPNGWGKNLLRPMGDTIAGLPERTPWGGQRVAPIDPMWGNALNWGSSYGMPGGYGFTNMMQPTMGAGQGALGAIGGGLDYLGGMQGRGPNQFGLDLGTGAQIAQFLAPGVQNMFDVQADNIQRDYNFNQLPGLKMNDALAGGGVGWGQTATNKQSVLGDAMTAANIRNMGTNLWQNAANQAVQGATTGGIQNMAAARQMDQDMLQGYSRFGSLGGNLMNQAWNMGQGGINTALGAGGQYQQYLQNLRDVERQRYDEVQNQPWNDAADRLSLIRMGAIGTPQTVGMSPFEGAMQGIMAGAGIYGMGRDAGWWGGGNNFIPSGWNTPFDQGSAWDESF